MKNVIKDIYQEKNPQAISAPEEKTTLKRGKLLMKCIGQGVAGGGKREEGERGCNSFPKQVVNRMS